MNHAPIAQTAMNAPEPQKIFCYSRKEILKLLAVQSPLTLDFSHFPNVSRTTWLLADIQTPQDLDHTYNGGPVLVKWEGQRHNNALCEVMDDCGSHSIGPR